MTTFLLNFDQLQPIFIFSFWFDIFIVGIFIFKELWVGLITMKINFVTFYYLQYRFRKTSLSVNGSSLKADWAQSHYILFNSLGFLQEKSTFSFKLFYALFTVI